MKFLRMVNCHLDHCLPKDSKNQVDWHCCEITPMAMKQWYVNGHVAADKNSDHVSLLPLSGEPCAAMLKVVYEVNNNTDPRDSAEIIGLEQYEVDKALIDQARIDMKAASKEAERAELKAEIKAELEAEAVAKLAADSGTEA